MKITNSVEAQGANERFNYFHDRFFRRLELAHEPQLVDVTESETFTDQIEDWNERTAVIEILHCNYDYPNQPQNRIVLIQANDCLDLLENVERFLGKDIFDLRFVEQKNGIACILIHHPDDAFVRSAENGTRVTLFVAESIEIREALYEPRPSERP